MKREAWKHYADADLLARVTLRCIEPDEKACPDTLISQRHDLGNAHWVGRPLQSVAEVEGQWVALPGWNRAADPLNGRKGHGR